MRGVPKNMNELNNFDLIRQSECTFIYSYLNKVVLLSLAPPKSKGTVRFQRNTNLKTESVSPVRKFKSVR